MYMCCAACLPVYMRPKWNSSLGVLKDCTGDTLDMAPIHLPTDVTLPPSGGLAYTVPQPGRLAPGGWRWLFCSGKCMIGVISEKRNNFHTYYICALCKNDSFQYYKHI